MSWRVRKGNLEVEDISITHWEWARGCSSWMSSTPLMMTLRIKWTFHFELPLLWRQNLSSFLLFFFIFTVFTIPCLLQIFFSPYFPQMKCFCNSSVNLHFELLFKCHHFMKSLPKSFSSENVERSFMMMKILKGSFFSTWTLSMKNMIMPFVSGHDKCRLSWIIAWSLLSSQEHHKNIFNRSDHAVSYWSPFEYLAWVFLLPQSDVKSRVLIRSDRIHRQSCWSIAQYSVFWVLWLLPLP